MARGLFITLEGGDGVGKTTQFALLEQALRERGHDVVALHEPGGTALGDSLRALLLDASLAGKIEPTTELLLFEAARAQIVAEVIEPALAAGKIVLCDRFYDSTTAYQGYGRELGPELCEQLNAVATGGLRPDVTLLLALPDDVAASRVACRSADGKGDRMEQAGAAFRERTAAGFAAIAAAEPERVHVVDAGGSIEEVHARLMAEVRALRSSASCEGSLTTASGKNRPSPVRDDGVSQARHPEQRSVVLPSASSKDPAQNALRSSAPPSDGDAA